MTSGLTISFNFCFGLRINTKISSETIKLTNPHRHALIILDPLYPRKMKCLLVDYKLAYGLALSMISHNHRFFGDCFKKPRRESYVAGRPVDQVKFKNYSILFVTCKVRHFLYIV